VMSGLIGRSGRPEDVNAEDRSDFDRYLGHAVRRRQTLLALLGTAPPAAAAEPALAQPRPATTTPSTDPTAGAAAPASSPAAQPSRPRPPDPRRPSPYRRRRPVRGRSP